MVQHLIAFLCLFAISLGCFAPDLSAYFMSDDFQFISYVADHLRDNPLGLLANLWSCSFDLAYSQHYRPLIVLPYIFDWCLWGANPFGWHVTNLVLHVLASFCVYLLGVHLLTTFPRNTACGISGLAAAIFAAAPQHAEPVISIVCRVDSICTTLYLLTIVAYIKSRKNNSKKQHALTTALLVLSLFSKESAATLPMILAFVCMAGELEQSHSNLRAAIKVALKETKIFWMILVAFIIIRALALGTLIGGYTGATGILLDACRIQRWTNPTLIASVIFPVNVCGDEGILVRVLAIVYLVMGIALVIRLFAAKISRQESFLYMFLSGWFVVSLLPVAQAWWINYAMLGGRHLYLPSVPLCLLIAITLLKPLANETKPLVSKISIAVSMLSIVALTGTYGAICVANDKAWVEAGEQSRAIINSIQKECERLEPNQKILVLNLPVFYRGVLCFFFADAIRPAFREYFCKTDCSDKVITLEPQNLFPVLVNRPLLERVLNQPETYKIFRWDTETKTLTPFKCDRTGGDFPRVIAVRNRELLLHPRSTRFSIDAIPKINPWKFDGLKVIIGSVGTPGFSIYKPFSGLTWNDRQNYSGYSDEQLDPVLASPFARFNSDADTEYKYFLDEHLDWLLSGPVNRLSLNVWSSRTEKLSACEQISNRDLIPQLEPDESALKLDYDGAYLAKPGSAEYKLKFDASSLARAQKVAVELSAPFDRFEIPEPSLDVSPTFHSSKFCPRAAKRWTIEQTKGQISIGERDLPKPAHYQVRLFALASDNSVIGYGSYPVTIANAQTVSNKR